MGTLLQTVSSNLQRHCSKHSDTHLSDRHAAVLVPLYETPEGGVRVILSQRSVSLRTHSGEVCFPGGKVDPSDEFNHITCALREAREELGIDTDSLLVLGCLQPFLSKHLLSVTPVVAIIRDIQDMQFTPNVEEVEHVFSAPLDMFLAKNTTGSRYSSRDAEWGDFMFRLHAWEYSVTRSLAEDTGRFDRGRRMTRRQARIVSPDAGQSFLIWGLTAAILIHVASLGFDRKPSFEVVPADDERYCCLSDIVAVGKDGIGKKPIEKVRKEPT